MTGHRLSLEDGLRRMINYIIAKLYVGRLTHLMLLDNLID